MTWPTPARDYPSIAAREDIPRSIGSDCRDRERGQFHDRADSPLFGNYMVMNYIDIGVPYGVGVHAASLWH